MKNFAAARALIVLALFTFADCAVVDAQSTAFTYQGNLIRSGVPATGSYDFQLGLFSAASGGVAVNNVTNSGVSVSNGLFTTTIDFGNVFNGTNYYLDIAIRSNGSTGAFTPLAARQPLTAAPYALYAPSSGTVTGVISITNLPSSVALLTSNQVFTGTVTATSFSGDGSGLTNLPTTTNAIGYLFAYDTTTQSATTPLTFQNVNFSAPGAQLSGFMLPLIGPSANNFTCTNGGMFLVQYDANLTGTFGRTASFRGTVNNVEIVGSQAAVSLGTNAVSTVTPISKSFLAHLNTADVFRLQFTADGATASLAPAGAGTTRPSVSLSIIRVN